MNKFKVGNIVLCRGKYKSAGHKGFVEEIVRDKSDRFTGTAFQPLYSIYGLEPIKFASSGQADWYYGDHLEEDLESTGTSMTTEMLEQYKKNLVGGFVKDIDIVIKNLGRTQGRNEQ